MTLFIFTLEFNQGVSHAFDQDEVRQVGIVRVRGTLNVLSDSETVARHHIDEIYVKKYNATNVMLVQQFPVHLHAVAYTKAYGAMSTVEIGPRQIDPHWKDALEADRRH